MSNVLNIKNLDHSIEADHVLFAMVRLQNDSRTLNLSRSLLDRGDSVIVVGLLDEGEEILGDGNQQRSDGGGCSAYSGK